jgi:Aspartyl protease
MLKKHKAIRNIRSSYPAPRIGSAIIRLLLLIIGSILVSATSPSAADDALSNLLARARTAINYGHAHTRSIHTSGTINIGGLAGTYESWTDVSNGRYTETVDDGPFSGSSGYDGTVQWNEDAKGIVFPQNAPGSVAHASNRRFVNTYALFAPDYGGAAVSYVGARSDGGQSYDVISVRPRGGYSMEWWFNSGSALPERRIETIMGRTTTSTLADYRNVGGWMIAYKETEATDNDYQITTKVTSVETDPPDLEQRLRMPRSRANDYSLSGAEVRVPMEFFQNQIYVDVMINGKGPFHLLFDSGAFNLIDPTVAYQVGGQVVASLHAMTGLGTGVRESQYIKVDTVSLGGANLSDQYFTVAQLGPRTNYVPLYEKPWHEMQGLIGYEFLARYRVTIDYTNSQLILHMPSAAKSSGVGTAVPVTFGERKVFVSCSLAGVPSSCLVDTGGSFGALVNKPFIDAHPQVLPHWYTGSGYIWGVNGSSRIRSGELSSLTIGSESVTDVDSMFGVEDKGGLSDPFFGALIGNRILKRFTVTFDYPNATLYIAPIAISAAH